MKIQSTEINSFGSYIGTEDDDVRHKRIKDTHSVGYTDPISKEKKSFGCGSRVSVRIVGGNIIMRDIFDGTTKILPPGSVIYAD